MIVLTSFLFFVSKLVRLRFCQWRFFAYLYVSCLFCAQLVVDVEADSQAVGAPASIPVESSIAVSNAGNSQPPVIPIGPVIPSSFQASSSNVERPSATVFLMQTIFYVSVGWLVFYMLVIRPKEREDGEHKKFFSSLKKGDEVLVASAFIGKVFTIKPDVVTVELAPDVKVKVVPKAVCARSPVVVDTPPVASRNSKT